MKIEIDLNDILGGEFETETLSDSIRRQVIEKLSSDIKSNIGKKIDAEIASFINQTIREHITKFMPDTIAALMDTEYRVVDRYGDRGKEPTTFRKELVKAIQENMVYQPNRYSSDENIFTKSVKAVVESNVSKFKTDFSNMVNAEFTKECFEYARTELQKKLGIK